MDNLYNPHKDPVVVILFLALIFAGGMAFMLSRQLDQCLGTNHTPRGIVHILPLGPGVQQKITTHEGKVYVMVQAPTAPENLDKAR